MLFVFVLITASTPSSPCASCLALCWNEECTRSGSMCQSAVQYQLNGCLSYPNEADQILWKHPVVKSANVYPRFELNRLLRCACVSFFVIFTHTPKLATGSPKCSRSGITSRRQPKKAACNIPITRFIFLWQIPRCRDFTCANCLNCINFRDKFTRSVSGLNPQVMSIPICRCCDKTERKH